MGPGTNSVQFPGPGPKFCLYSQTKIMEECQKIPQNCYRKMLFSSKGAPKGSKVSSTSESTFELCLWRAKNRKSHSRLHAVLVFKVWALQYSIFLGSTIEHLSVLPWTLDLLPNYRNMLHVQMMIPSSFQNRSQHMLKNGFEQILMFWPPRTGENRFREG